jgi:hypothetical protein
MEATEKIDLLEQQTAQLCAALMAKTTTTTTGHNCSHNQVTN